MKYEVFQFKEIGEQCDPGGFRLQNEAKDNWEIFNEFITTHGDVFIQNGLKVLNYKLGNETHNKVITLSHLCHSSKTISKPIISFSNTTGFIHYKDNSDDIEASLNTGGVNNLDNFIDDTEFQKATANIPILDSISNLNEISMVLFENRILKIPLYRNCVIGEILIEPFSKEELDGIITSALFYYIVKRLTIQMKRYKYDRLLKLFVEYSCSDPMDNQVFHHLTRNLCYYLNVKYSFVCSIENGVGRTLSFCDNGNILNNFEYLLADTPCGEVMKSKPVYFPCNLQKLFPRDIWLVENNVESYLGIPLQSTGGKTIGSLCVMSDKAFSAEPLYTSILAAMANKTAIEIERRKTIEKYIITQELIDQSPTAIFLTTTSGQIISSYGAVNSLFGYSEKEICGKSIDILQKCTQGCTTCINLSALGSDLNKLCIKEIKKEVICLQKSSDTFPGEVCIRSIYDNLSNSKDPKFLGIMFVIRDIKESKQNQQQLLEMNKQLSTKNSELIDARDRALQAIAGKSQFIATISHEIRTPMNAVIGMAELLLSSKLTGEQLAIAEEIYKSSDLLLSITSDCLDFSKIEASKLELEIIDFDFIGCIEGAVETLSISLINKPIEILLTFDKSVPRHLKGDPNKIRQVILNMGFNSIKYTTSGHIFISICAEIALNRSGRIYYRIKCKIEDTGIGISENQKVHLFQPFVQMDTSVSRKYGGTGLGLTICKEISKLMSGDVTLITSTPGKGSEFLFTAILEKSQLTPPNSNNPSPLLLPINSTTNGINEDILDQFSLLSKSTILLIDDYEFGRNILIKKLLQELSCSITTKTSQEFIELLNQNQNNNQSETPEFLISNTTNQIYDLILVVEREFYIQNTNFFSLSDQIQNLIESTNNQHNTALVLCTNFKLHNTSNQYNNNFKFLILHKPLSTNQITKILNHRKLKNNLNMSIINNAITNGNGNGNSNLELVNSNQHNVLKRKLEDYENGDQSAIKRFKVNGKPMDPLTLDNGDVNNNGNSDNHNEDEEDVSKRLKWNILLVEDNAVNRKVLSMQLKKLGFKCDSAKDGSEAIEMFKCGKYDLIFMDLTMPIIDGPTATLQIRSYEEISNITKKVVIVALTATVLEGSKKYCKSMGMNDFLMKPLKISELEKVLLFYLPDNQKC